MLAPTGRNPPIWNRPCVVPPYQMMSIFLLKNKSNFPSTTPFQPAPTITLLHSKSGLWLLMGCLLHPNISWPVSHPNALLRRNECLLAQCRQDHRTQTIDLKWQIVLHLGALPWTNILTSASFVTFRRKKAKQLIAMPVPILCPKLPSRSHSTGQVGNRRARSHFGKTKAIPPTPATGYENVDDIV